MVWGWLGSYFIDKKYIENMKWRNKEDCGEKITFIKGDIRDIRKKKKIYIFYSLMGG